MRHEVTPYAVPPSRTGLGGSGARPKGWNDGALAERWVLAGVAWRVADGAPLAVSSPRPSSSSCACRRY